MEAEDVVPLDTGGRALEVGHGELGGAKTVFFVVDIDGPDVYLQRLGHEFVFRNSYREVFTKGWFGKITDCSGAECAHHICQSW